MPSKQVTDRQKSAAAVIAAAHAHSARAAESFKALFSPVAAKNTKLPDIVQLFALSAAALERATAAMVESDVAHERELADDNAPRAARDELAEELYADLVELREVATGLLGQSSLSLLGLTGPTPRDPVVLVRTAREVIHALESKKLPKSRVRGATFHVNDWIERLSDRATQLEAAIEKVTREAREAEATMTNKTRAIAEYDDAFRKVATLLSACLSISGETELAARVRPTARRPGRVAETEEDSSTEVPAPLIGELEPS